MAINVVLEDPQLTVLGPPAQLDLNVNSGETGPRGSYIYSGSGNPNTNTLLTDKLLGDLFIRTDTGFDYGAVYQYSSLPGGPEWVKILDINVDTQDIFLFLTAASAFATSASISAINASNFETSASGFALSSSNLYISTLVALQSAISSASNALVSEQNSLSYYLSSSAFFVSSETNALSSFNSAVSASNEALNSFNSATSASVSAACALYLTSLNNSYAASSQFWANAAEQSATAGAASAAYWVDIAEQNALSASNLYVTRDNEINTTIDFRSASVMFTSSSVSGLDFGIDDATVISYASSASSNAVVVANAYTDSEISSASTFIVSSIVNSAPETLDTLNELASALGNDANFSTTVTNNIATKLSIASASATYATFEFAAGAANSASANADVRALEYANSASANSDTRALGYANSASANSDTRALGYANSASAHVNSIASATYLTISGTQTATNKTLTSPTINGGSVNSVSSVSSSTITVSGNQTLASFRNRNVYIDTGAPSGGNDGDVWIRYTV